jgi:hypothetical protein
MLDCPSVRFTGFLIERDGMVCGHLLLSGCGQEVRVADLVIDSEVVGDWLACYSLAAFTAKRSYPRAGRLTATAASGFLQQALLQAGFSAGWRMPVLAEDRHSMVPPGQVFVLNMMDSDAAFLLLSPKCN